LYHYAILKGNFVDIRLIKCPIVKYYCPILAGVRNVHRKSFSARFIIICFIIICLIIICFIKKLNKLMKNNLKQVRDIRMRVLKAAKYKFL